MSQILLELYFKIVWLFIRNSHLIGILYFYLLTIRGVGGEYNARNQSFPFPTNPSYIGIRKRYSRDLFFKKLNTHSVLTLCYG